MSRAYNCRRSTPARTRSGNAYAAHTHDSALQRRIFSLESDLALAEADREQLCDQAILLQDQLEAANTRDASALRAASDRIAALEREKYDTHATIGSKSLQVQPRLLLRQRPCRRQSGVRVPPQQAGHQPAQRRPVGCGQAGPPPAALRTAALRPAALRPPTRWRCRARRTARRSFARRAPQYRRNGRG